MDPDECDIVERKVDVHHCDHDDYEHCAKPNTAIVPEPVVDVQGDGRWMSMHKHSVRECQVLKPKILFVGDSLIHQMKDTQEWTVLFEPMNAVNAGIGADKAENVLWRLQNGLLDSCSPEIVVLLVGTNNHGNNAEEIVEALETIAWYINGSKPHAKIVVMGLLPRGEHPNPLREKMYQVNDGLERISHGISNTHFFDCDSGFVREDGTIRIEDMPDFLHLSRKAYTRLNTLLHGFLKKLQKEIVSYDEDYQII